ncbi:uncharacterized protein LOC124168735 [Ischnura elegans]|uniref:uncharacterized protein LOC124168735 n=1 Tax=Ischnura elegans TaxID=197161 RepID=UPI001ED870D4|nr:uncharacterized protein LOC124168735 [Ischnura elegans]
MRLPMPKLYLRLLLWSITCLQTVPTTRGLCFAKCFPIRKLPNDMGVPELKQRLLLQKCAWKKERKLLRTHRRIHSLLLPMVVTKQTKLYPIVVTFFSPELREIQNCLLSVPNFEGDATGVNIADLLLSTLREFHIPLKYCLAFGADNAPVMVGQKKGVAACLKQEIGNLIIVGCPCHLINLAAEKGAACLPLNVDENIIDIFYYLERSAKRKEKFRKFQTLHDTEVRKILKHVPTRWLSLKRCLDRILDQWNPLLSLFKDEIVSNDSGEGTLKNYKIPKHIQSADVSNSEPKSKHYDTILCLSLRDQMCLRKSVFFKSVRKCFSSSCDYMIHKFPFKDEVLIHAEVADISNIGKASFSSLRFFINRFPDILTREMEQLDAEVDILHSQFCNFQLQETNITAERIDVQWALIGQMKSADGVLKYDRLAKVMLAILSIPHSNAECERIFSTVTKKKTQFRSMLSETSLEKFLILKSIQKGKCFEQKFSPEFLKKAKSATTSVLNK